MSERIYNFSAGPAVLPEPVLRKAQEAVWNVDGSGIGIMEHSHRGKVFDRILDDAEAACRELAGIPDNYRVLFLQGGASLQFSMVPMNLLDENRTADYLLTGVWAQKAVKEAKVVGGKVHIAASSESTHFDRIPKWEEISYSANPAYVQYVASEIAGFHMPSMSLVPELHTRARKWQHMIGANFEAIFRDLHGGTRLLHAVGGAEGGKDVGAEHAGEIRIASENRLEL